MYVIIDWDTRPSLFYFYGKFVINFHTSNIIKVLLVIHVHNAFLHGDLDEEVYMDQLPQGILPTQPNQVCKLKKLIYGLKQSSGQWFAQLSSSLISQGFKQSSSNRSLFFRHTTNSFTF